MAREGRAGPTVEENLNGSVFWLSRPMQFYTAINAPRKRSELEKGWPEALALALADEAGGHGPAPAVVAVVAAAAVAAAVVAGAGGGGGAGLVGVATRPFSADFLLSSPSEKSNKSSTSLFAAPLVWEVTGAAGDVDGVSKSAKRSSTSLEIAFGGPVEATGWAVAALLLGASRSENRSSTQFSFCAGFDSASSIAFRRASSFSLISSPPDAPGTPQKDVPEWSLSAMAKNIWTGCL
mmetsp:Transcript_57763/g.126564  ORF Transcript_57763/g.126564 Transcript_57763/m.126564 type:complete len:237 (+) Transcript_57763:1688-2398(+)